MFINIFLIKILVFIFVILIIMKLEDFLLTFIINSY